MPGTIYQPVVYYPSTATSSTPTWWYGNGNSNQYRLTWSSTNTTTTWANDVVWQYWVNATPTMTGAMRPLIADHQQCQQRQAERQLATVRARALLEDFLSDEQKAELEQGFFHVVGSRGRRYCIRAYGQAGNVDLLRPDGALQARLCAHPRDGLPDADAWLAQMLELRHDEEHFLRTANVHAGYLPNDLARAA